MNQYVLNIELNVKLLALDRHFTIEDLYPETIQMINNFYHNDFVNLVIKSINIGSDGLGYDKLYRIKFVTIFFTL